MPDCTTCILRDVCPRFQAGTFCTSWQGSPPPKRDPKDSPSARFMRGELDELEEGAGE